METAVRHMSKSIDPRTQESTGGRAAKNEGSAKKSARIDGRGIAEEEKIAVSDDEIEAESTRSPKALTNR